MNGKDITHGKETAKSFDRGLRRQSIVAELLSDVFRGRYRPGEHLVTQELAERFDVSHTPVREALIALSGVGVIDLVPNRGAIVRQLTAKDVREVCLVRRALECEAVRSACGRIDLTALNEIAAELRRLIDVPIRSAARFIAKARVIDGRLHDLIANSAGNALLAGEIGRLKMLFRAYRDVAWDHHAASNDFHRLAGEAHEHLAIVEALLAANRRAANRAMSKHILSGLKYWGRALPAAAADAKSSNSSSNGSHRGRAVAAARQSKKVRTKNARPTVGRSNEMSVTRGELAGR
ncbi:MAG: GntR family transcriptional regulator [Pirellulales bacterium]